MKKQLIITIFIMMFISTPLFGVGNKCDTLKKEYEVKLSKFNDVKSQMSKPDITKEKYNELYKRYTVLWSEASQIKKKIQECEEGVKSKHLAVFNEGIAFSISIGL